MPFESFLLATNLAVSKPEIDPNLRIAQMQSIFKRPKTTEQHMKELTNIIWSAWGCFYSNETVPLEYKTIHKITCNKPGMNDFNIQDILSQLNQIGRLSEMNYSVEYKPLSYTADNRAIPREFILIIQGHP